MAAAAAMIGGGVIGAYGQLQQGQAARQAGEYNAKMAEQNAKFTLEQAAADENQLRAQVRRQLGQSRASIGASGVTMEGSPSEVIEDSAAQAEMDALKIRRQGDMKAWNFRNEAKLQRFQGQQAQTGANYGAVGTLLGAGAKSYDMYSR
jgi:hypothetical protein